MTAYPGGAGFETVAEPVLSPTARRLESEMRFRGLLVRLEVLDEEFRETGDGSQPEGLELVFHDPEVTMFGDETDDKIVTRNILSVEESKSGIVTLTHRTFDADYLGEVAPPETIVKGAFLIAEPTGNILLGEGTNMDRWSGMLERGLGMNDNEAWPPRRDEITRAITYLQALNGLIPVVDLSLSPDAEPEFGGQFDIRHIHKGLPVMIKDTPVNEITGQRGIMLEYTFGSPRFPMVRRLALEPKVTDKGEIIPILQATDHVDSESRRHDDIQPIPMASRPLGRGDVTNLVAVLEEVFSDPETEVLFFDGKTAETHELGSFADNSDAKNGQLELAAHLIEAPDPMLVEDFVSAAELKIGPQLWGAHQNAEGDGAAYGSYESSDGSLRITAYHPLFIQIEMAATYQQPARLIRVHGKQVFEYSEDVPEVEESERAEKLITGPGINARGPNKISPKLFTLYHDHYPGVLASYFITGMQPATQEVVIQAHQRVTA